MPITISDIINKEVRGCQFDIVCDNTVLITTGDSSAGTITGLWKDPTASIKNTDGYIGVG